MVNLISEHERSLATLIILCYNQESYIEEAIDSALAQTYHPLEIIVSDDCSNDRTYELAKAKVSNYSGAHKIIIRQNEKNLGVARHFSLLSKLASGEIVIAAAGDDISLPERTSLVMGAFKKYPNLTFYETALLEFGENMSSIEYFSYRDRKLFEIFSLIQTLRTRLVGAGRAYRKEVLLKFPPLNTSCPSEDSPSILRCLIIGAGLYEPIVSVKHRKHGENLSNPHKISTAKLVALKQQYLSDIDYSIKNNLSCLKTLVVLRKSIALQSDYRICKKRIGDCAFSYQFILLNLRLIYIKTKLYFR